MENQRKNEEEETTEDEDYEPQVTSKNPTERIMARRLRIERRVEALRKQKELKEAEEAGALVTTEDEVKKTPIELQVEKSTDLLEKLILEGEEYVTNVRIATEAREVDRRDREGLGKEKLLKQLEEEAEAANSMFNEIADKWSGILKYNDPLHINDDMMAQKEKCDDLIKQKDAIIASLKEKLKKAEINFNIDQRKMMEDVNSIAKRIENQIIIMRKAYRQEIQMVEDVILAERHLMMEASNKKWDELYKKRDQEENSNADLRSEDYWNFVKDMDELVRDFKELYRETTIKLENDCDELQREYERIKHDAVINGEKLDYNYQILKKREDENLIIRTQQKRRINKLQDLINSLRKKNDDYHNNTQQQIEKLREEVKKLSKNILDVEKKADHMAAVNNAKFRKIWEMNRKRADNLLKRVLEIDRVLHEQQLGLIWKPPEQPFKSRMDLTTLAKSQSGVTQRVPTDLKLVAEESEMKRIGHENNPVYKKILRQILTLIADKGGFLIEDQLYAIIEPYLECEKTLVKVDSVFEALHVTDRSDIDLLFEFFLPYMFCPICNVSSGEKTGDEESLMKIHEMDPVILKELAASESKLKSDEILPIGEEIIDGQSGTPVEMGALHIVLYDEHLKGECKGPQKTDERGAKETESKMVTVETRGRSKIPCQFQHPLMISSVYVLKALKEFLGMYHIPMASVPTMNVRLSRKRSTASRLINPDDIESYWQKYIEAFPKEREQLWDSLLEGLKKYHELLKARKVTSEDVVGLRQQNCELRRVFANYIDKNDIPY